MEDMYLEDQLIWACSTNDIETVRKLLENGVNVHAKNDFASKTICSFSYLEMARLLVKQRVSINIDNHWPLIITCYFGYIELIKLLLEYEVDCSILNLDKCSFKVQEVINNHIMEKILLNGR